MTEHRRHSEAEQGDAVWFDLGSGWEQGTVWAVGHHEVAVGVGENPATGEFIERKVLDQSVIYTESEKAALGWDGDQ